jgi:hypothetical protein
MITKTPGVGSIHLETYRDKDGDWLDGGKSYRLRISPNPPMQQFWAVSVYDIDTRTFFRNETQKAEISSNAKELLKNADGSVDLYSGRRLPAARRATGYRPRRTSSGSRTSGSTRRRKPTSIGAGRCPTSRRQSEEGGTLYRATARRISMIWVLLELLGAGRVYAQGGAQSSPPSDADLAQQLSNPVASLVSVPLQFNWDQPTGLDDDTRFTLNFQPVVPISLNENWNLVGRWIMPYVAQPRLYEGAVPTSGLGDIVASAFFSPVRPGKIVWGAGPVLLLPTTSDPALGSGKWGIRFR